MAKTDRKKPPIRIAIAYHRHRQLEALKAFLSTYQDIEVISEAPTGIGAVTLAEWYHPDVILVDSDMHIMSGLRASKYIKRHWPEIGVIVVTMHEESVFEAQAVGADAVILVGEQPERLVTVIRQVARKVDTESVSNRHEMVRVEGE